MPIRDFGNNIQLCKALKLRSGRSFFESHGQPIGLLSNQRIATIRIGGAVNKGSWSATPSLSLQGRRFCRRIG
jgi:hypothetical protein